jgi:hypothetical protein
LKNYENTAKKEMDKAIKEMDDLKKKREPTRDELIEMYYYI